MEGHMCDRLNPIIRIRCDRLQAMVTRRNASRGRRALDARLLALGSPDRFTRPPAGWIRAIRDALGMSGSDLGRRMGVSQPSVTELERSERNGTIRLETLRRAAEAMGCTLVYALLPTESLEGIIRRRAEELVDDRLSRVQHTMALEDQAAQVTKEARQELIRELETSGRLWDAQ